MRAFVVIIGLFSFLGTGIGLSLLRQSQRSHAAEKALVTPPPVVTVLKLERRTVPIRESFYGLIEPWEKVDLALTRAGQVEVIGKFKEGTRQYEYKIEEESAVQAGQQILRLEGSKERAQLASAEAMVEQARAGVESARGEVRRVEAAVEAARASVSEAEAEQQHALDEFERISRLRAENHASTTEMDRIRTDKRRADARMRISQAGLQQAVANLESARAQLGTARAKLGEAEAHRDAAMVDLAQTVLLAPISGVISELPTEEGEVVSAGQKVAVLMDVSRVKLVVGVVERKVSALKVGIAVRVHIEAVKSALGRKQEVGQYSGAVTRVSVAADETSGLFLVEIVLANEDGLLRPGMVGRAEVAVDEVEAFPIPVEAMLNRDGMWSVFFLDRSEKEGLQAVRMALPDGLETDEFRLVDTLPETRRELIYEGQRRLDEGDKVTVAAETTLDRRWDYKGRLEEFKAAIRSSLAGGVSN